MGEEVIMSNYENSVLTQIISDYSQKELVNICKQLNKNYNIYDTEDARWSAISHAFYRTDDLYIEELKKTVLSNKLINDLLFSYYPCERVIKYYLIERLLHYKDDIVAFEMSVGGSRIDICRINGGSYAYEIKTEYDSYDRLQGQMSDYLKYFEKVYVVVPKQNAKLVCGYIPKECGIITYRFRNKNCIVFDYYRKSIKHKCDIDLCLRNLSSQDLSLLLKISGNHNKQDKQSKINYIIQNMANAKKELLYKKVLKSKYNNNWMFIVNNFTDILPIDVQSFFSSTMSPSILYKK